MTRSLITSVISRLYGIGVSGSRNRIELERKQLLNIQYNPNCKPKSGFSLEIHLYRFDTGFIVIFYFTDIFFTMVTFRLIAMTLGIVIALASAYRGDCPSSFTTPLAPVSIIGWLKARAARYSSLLSALDVAGLTDTLDKGWFLLCKNKYIRLIIIITNVENTTVIL